MPSLPSSGGGGNDDMEFMKNVAYLIKESGMGYKEIMDLPYQIFLSLLKHFRILELEKTEEGREYLEQVEILNRTEPDFEKLRKQGGYRST